MDKVLTQQLMKVNNIPTTQVSYFYKNRLGNNKQSILEDIKTNLKWPVFIKPVHLGSSIGISKVKDQDLKRSRI